MWTLVNVCAAGEKKLLRGVGRRGRGKAGASESVVCFRRQSRDQAWCALQHALYVAGDTQRQDLSVRNPCAPPLQERREMKLKKESQEPGCWDRYLDLSVAPRA